MAQENNPIPDTTGHFLLEMPLSKANKAAQALQLAGVWFEPEKAITGRVDRVGMHVNFTGHSIQDVVDQINAHRKSEDLEGQITVAASKMTLLQRHTILTFAAERCDWDNEYPTPNIHGIDSEAWETLQEEQPELFKQ